MRITSPAFDNNASLPSRYTCDGEDINPPLGLVDVPAEAQSLALIVDDPDAPAGTWVHWTVWNIPPDVRSLGENSVPSGAGEGMTSFGRTGWGGPCPPSGIHRYFFKLFALDTVLNLTSSVDITTLEKAMEGHILARAELIGWYKRN